MASPPAATEWFVYVLVSQRLRRSYVGVSPDPERRLTEHNGERAGGARSTRAGRPWRIAVTYGPFEGRGAAQSAERRVKQLRGAQRLHAQGLFETSA